MSGGEGGDGAAARVAAAVGFGALPEVPEAVRLAEAVRRLMDATVTSRLAPGELAAVAERLEDAAARLEVGAAGGGRFDGLPAGEDGSNPFPMSTHPTLGRANPLAPPLVVESAGDGVVRATADYGAAYEGLPGRVHGGYVAAAFDTMLGFAAAFAGHAGVTGSLSLRFRRPTALGSVVYEAWADRVEGRKAIVRGRLLAGGEETVEAEAVFVSVATEQLTGPPGG